jgi:Fe-S oxidoreductase
LLGDAGLILREPEHAGTSSWCCGGPVESLYPKKASEQAVRRVEELRAAASAAVTMCPICYVNLQKAAKDAMRFDDISDYLVRAFGV